MQPLIPQWTSAPPRFSVDITSPVAAWERRKEEEDEEDEEEEEEEGGKRRREEGGVVLDVYRYVGE